MGTGKTQRREISTGQEGDLGQTISSFWICSLIFCSVVLMAYESTGLTTVTRPYFSNGLFWDFISRFQPIYQTLFPTTHHSLPVTGHSSFGSPYGSPLQLQSLRSMIFCCCSFLITSFSHLIPYLMPVHLLPFKYTKDTVKLNPLKGYYGFGDAIQILSQAHHKFKNRKEGLSPLPRKKSQIMICLEMTLEFKQKQLLKMELLKC